MQVACTCTEVTCQGGIVCGTGQHRSQPSNLARSVVPAPLAHAIGITKQQSPRPEDPELFSRGHVAHKVVLKGCTASASYYGYGEVPLSIPFSTHKGHTERHHQPVRIW